MTRGDMTTSQQTDANGKRGAIGRGWGRGRVERTRGGGVNTTTSPKMRDNPVGSEGGGDGDGDGNGDEKFCADTITGLGDDHPCSRN